MIARIAVAIAAMASIAHATMHKQTLTPYLCEAVAYASPIAWQSAGKAESSNNMRATTPRLELGEGTNALECWYAAPVIPLLNTFLGLNVRVEGQQAYGNIADWYIGIVVPDAFAGPSFPNQYLWHNGPADTIMGHPSDDAFSYHQWGVPWCLASASVPYCLDGNGAALWNINATRGIAVYLGVRQLPGSGPASARVDTITVDVIYED